MNNTGRINALQKAQRQVASASKLVNQALEGTIYSESPQDFVPEYLAHISKKETIWCGSSPATITELIRIFKKKESER